MATIPPNDVGTFPTLPAQDMCTPDLSSATLPGGPLGDPQAVAQNYDGAIFYDVAQSPDQAPLPQKFQINPDVFRALEKMWGSDQTQISVRMAFLQDSLSEVFQPGEMNILNLEPGSSSTIIDLTSSEGERLGSASVIIADGECFAVVDITPPGSNGERLVGVYQSSGARAPHWVSGSGEHYVNLGNGGKFQITFPAGPDSMRVAYINPSLAARIITAPVLDLSGVPAGGALVETAAGSSVLGNGDVISLPETGYAETVVHYQGERWIIYSSEGQVSLWNDGEGGAVSSGHGRPLINKGFNGTPETAVPWTAAEDVPFVVTQDRQVIFTSDPVYRLLLTEISPATVADAASPFAHIGAELFDATHVSPAVESSVTHSLPQAASVSLSHIGMSAAGGVAGGLIGLGVVEGYEQLTGEEMCTAGEFATYTASGVGTGVIATAIAGQAVSAGTLLPSFVSGVAAGVPIFVGVSVSEELMGVDSTSVEGQAGTIVVGSGLAAAAPFATVGGTSAAAAGFTAAGVGLSALSGVAVGGAAVAGVGIGIGIDHAVGVVVNSDGDGTLSGWMAEDEWNAAAVAGTVLAGPVAGLGIYGLGKLVHYFQSGDTQ